MRTLNKLISIFFATETQYKIDHVQGILKMKSKLPSLDIIIPIYNEIDCVNELFERLTKLREDFSSKLEVFSYSSMTDQMMDLTKHS